MAERAVRPAIDLAAEPARADPLARARRSRAGPTRPASCRMAVGRVAFGRAQRPPEVGRCRSSGRPGSSRARARRPRRPTAGRSGTQRRRPRNRRVQVAVQHRQRIVARERQPAGQHLEHDGAEAVDVGSRVDDRRRAAARARRRRSCRGTRAARSAASPRRLAQVGKAEVDDLVDALARAELVADDVGRLEVAMDDAAVVGELQRGAERRHDRRTSLERQPAALRRSLPSGSARSAAP